MSDVVPVSGKQMLTWSQIMAMLVIGIAFGWALSCAAMAAALKARNQTLLKETLQKEASRYLLRKRRSRVVH